jgi:SAM-dependent methyltransferase
MISALKQFVPFRIQRKMKEYLTNRRKVRLFGTLAPLVPDVEAMFDGPPTLEEFKANGEEFLRIYREIAHLQPNEKMLDVGCGTGRKTLPLTQYLNEHAVYQGIDITKAGID